LFLVLKNNFLDSVGFGCSFRIGILTGLQRYLPTGLETSIKDLWGLFMPFLGMRGSSAQKAVRRGFLCSLLTAYCYLSGFKV
jgi:hypothetical protein